MTDRKIYDEYIAGFVITHAMAAGKDKLSFVLQKYPEEQNELDKDASELPTRIISYSQSAFPKTGGYARLEWKYGINHLFVSLAPKTVAVTDFFSVWESKTDNQFHDICPGDGDALYASPFTRWCHGVCQIEDEVFAFGSVRKVFRRRGYDDWVELTADNDHQYLYKDIVKWEKNGKKHDIPMGFDTLDGFSTNDLYAGSNEGGLWRYDGKKWRQIPVDRWKAFDIKAITCASDGYVYASGSGQFILKGREKKWEWLETGWVHGNSSAWFNGKLYLGTRLGLFTLEGNKLIKYQFPDSLQILFPEYIDQVTAGKDCLLCYGHHHALVFDGEIWTKIV